MLLPLLSSILGILAFLPFNLYPVSFVFLIPLFIFFIREKRFWRLILGSIIFRLIFICGTVYYTLEPILWIDTIILFLGLPVSVWMIKKISANFDSSFITRSPHWNFIKSSFLTFIILPFLWTFFDHLEAHYSLTPTYIIAAGNALGSSPFAGLADFGGLITLTFFVALINAALAFLIFNNLSRKRSLCAKQNITMFILISILFFSAWKISNFELKKNSSDYAKLPNVIKFSAVSTTKEFDFNQFADLEDDLQKQYSDFVIFPENILNQQASSDTANNIFPLGNKSTLIFQNLAKKLDADVVVNYGTLQGNKNELKYNSAILFNNEGNIAGIHNKNRLIFIGEYWPFGNWHPSFYDWVKKNNPRMQTYAIFDQHNADLRGEQNLLSVTFQKKPVFFAAPICGEIHYLADLKKYQEKGAQFIVNQSSNRWLDNGLNHFLYLTENLKKIESIWLSIPIISSGVNDHAGIILPDGKRQMIEHENGDKNYGIFSGEIRY